MDIYDDDNEGSNPPRGELDSAIATIRNICFETTVPEGKGRRTLDCSKVEERLRERFAQISESEELEPFLRLSRFDCRNISRERVQCRRDFDEFGRPSLPFNPPTHEYHAEYHTVVEFPRGRIGPIPSSQIDVSYKRIEYNAPLEQTK
ncbi:hypothetical protein DSM21852_40580 [Methylocystis bryophila]|nr:hypothetical protein DSM21852_40580 [Methylocystis bryophila]